LRGFGLDATRRIVSSATVSGRDAMRASVWDAFFLSPLVRVERKSSASKCPSSVVRTMSPEVTASNDMVL
jgi:hypothetical protein